MCTQICACAAQNTAGILIAIELQLIIMILARLKKQCCITIGVGLPVELICLHARQPSIAKSAEML